VIDDITPTEFVRLCEDDARWQVLDVREPWEFEVSSIDNAILMPMSDVPKRISELDSTRPTAVLCRSGIRSRNVAEFLAEQGFARLINIAGGINAWSQEVDATLEQY
jgi:rhodanese-related sulfurtransferase